MISLNQLALTPGSVIGIGSLPMTDPAEAIAFVRDHSPRIPFWPQLPNRDTGEGLIAQSLAPAIDLLTPEKSAGSFSLVRDQATAFAGRLAGGAPGLHRESAAGFFKFVEAVETGIFKSAKAVKGQIAGPVTLTSFITCDGNPLSSQTDLVPAIASHLGRLAAWQAAKLAATGKQVIIFVDEPGIQVAGEALLEPEMAPLITGLSDILDAIRAAGAIAGIHCCGEMPFRLLEIVRPDILSFDAFNGLSAFFSDVHARAFLKSGGVVAYGLVPPDPDPAAHAAQILFDRFKRDAASISGEIPLAQLAGSALISASCGHGTVSPEAAARSFDIANGLSRLMAAAAI